MGVAALVASGVAVATPATAVSGPTGCSSWTDSKAIRGYAACTGGWGYVRVIVKCVDSRGVVASFEGSWVKTTDNATSSYICGGTYAWVKSTSYQAETRLHT